MEASDDTRNTDADALYAVLRPGNDCESIESEENNEIRYIGSAECMHLADPDTLKPACGEEGEVVQVESPFDMRILQIDCVQCVAILLHDIHRYE